MNRTSESTWPAEFTPGDLPAGLAVIIHRHSDGNPLFMTAMLDHLIRQDVLSRVGGRWMLTTPLEQVDPGVPETLRQMLEMQLQHTTEAQQRLLTCASVVGQRFTAVRAISPPCSQTTRRRSSSCVRDWCSGSSFSRLPGPRDYPCGKTAVEYEFRHWLYRDVLYRRLNPASRVGFHRRLAEGFEALGSMVQSEMAAEIALHFEEGHEYERAVHYLLLTRADGGAALCAWTGGRHSGSRGPAVAENPATTASGARLADSREDGQRLLCARRDGPGRRRLRLDGDACCGRGASDRAGRSPDASGASGRVDSILLARRRDQPHFAAAYIALSRIYSNLGETEPARTYAKRAYECREQSGKRERLSIAYQHHFEVTGDQASATATLEEWKRLFPLEFEPVNMFCVDPQLPRPFRARDRRRAGGGQP